MNIFIKAMLLSSIAAFVIASAGKIFLKPLTDPSYHTNPAPASGPAVASDVANPVARDASGSGGGAAKSNSSLTSGQDTGLGGVNSTELAAPGAQTGAPVADQ